MTRRRGTSFLAQLLQHPTELWTTTDARRAFSPTCSHAADVETFTLLHQHSCGATAHSRGVWCSHRALLLALDSHPHDARRLQTGAHAGFRRRGILGLRMVRSSSRFRTLHRGSGWRYHVAEDIYERTIRSGSRVLRRRCVHRAVCRTLLHSSDAKVRFQTKADCRIDFNNRAKCFDVLAGVHEPTKRRDGLCVFAGGN